MINDLKLYDNIYLKPIFRINIEVKISQLFKAEFLSKSISNWEIIEKLRKLSPKTLSDVTLKIQKSTTECLSFSADLSTRVLLKQTIFNLDKKKLKLNGFNNCLAVEACEIRYEYPLKHDWISHFRDAKGIDENEPGLRPDTVVISNLPIYWFSNGNKNVLGEVIPCEEKVRPVFETFGEIRRIDIPMLSCVQNLALLKRMELETSDVKKQTKLIKATFENALKIYESIVKASSIFKFTVYIQYKNILGFTKAIDTLRGSKLFLKEEGKSNIDENNMAEIKIDFDKTAHLTDKKVKLRNEIAQRIKNLEDTTHAERMKNYEKEKETLEAIKQQEFEEKRILDETQNRLKLEYETLKCLEEKKKRQKVASKECHREKKVLQKQLNLYKEFHTDYVTNLATAQRLQKRLSILIEKVDRRKNELVETERKSRRHKSKKKSKKHRKDSQDRETSPIIIEQSSQDTSVIKKRILMRLENNIRANLIKKKMRIQQEQIEKEKNNIE